MLARLDAVDILICHSPPKGVADRTSGGQSVGSTAIRDAVERTQPPLVLCGHIHDSWGAEGHIGASRIVNLGPRAGSSRCDGCCRSNRSRLPPFCPPRWR